jgi:hypothetical protein
LEGVEMKTRFPVLLTLLAVALIASACFAADDEQWLQYRTSREPGQSGVMCRPVSLTMLGEAPGVTLPDNAGYDAQFAKWETPMAKAGFIWLALTKSQSSGGYDRLFIDSNCDGSLKDETAVAPAQAQQGYAVFGPVKVVFQSADGPITYHINLQSYDMQGYKQTSLISAGWYEGTIKVAGKDVRCTLIDYNSNGTFNDVSEDLQNSDHIGIGVGADYAIVNLGKYCQVGDVLYHPEPARDGASITFAAAENVPMGTIKVPAGVSLVSIAGANGQVNLKPSGGVAQAPAGKWTVKGWQIAKTDKRGSKWTLTGGEAPKASAFEIVADKEAELAVGEPIVASLVANGKDKNWSFQETLKGHLGESVQLQENGSLPTAPKMRIKNEDASYDKVFSFTYG